MLIAPFIANAPQGLFGYLQEVNGSYSIPILTIVIVGYLTKRIPAIAAKVAIFSGVGFYLIYLGLKYFVVGEDALPHYLHVMAILFVLNVIIMFVIGKWKPRIEPFILDYTRQVDIQPWKLVKPVGLGIVVLVVFIYAYFAQ
jgi:SSS family solute:Na+ symporter